ncbi:MAG: MFS transporter [Anaerolineae bacterium]|nr:MFS transporter [Anaerolineae bacterium]
MTRRFNVALIAAVGFLYWVGLYLYVPTLPNYVQSKTTDLAMVGTILSMYGLWQGIIRLPIGIAADWRGRRKPFVAGCLALLALGAFLLGSAQSASGLLIARTITGLAAGTWVPLVVLFNAFFPPEDSVRATAMLNFVAFAGRMLATGLNGWLNELGGYTLAFYLAAGIAALAALLTLTTYEEARPPHPPSLAGLGKLATRRDVLLPSILSIIVHYIAFGTTFGFLPILAKEMGAGDVTQSMLVTLNVAMTIVSSVLVSSLVRWVDARLLVYASCIAAAMGTALAAYTPALTLLYLAQALLGIGFGIGYSVTMGMSIRYVAEHERTTAMGLYQALYSIGMFAGPWVSGMLAEGMGIRPMLYVTAIATLLPSLLLTAWLDTSRRATSPATATRR